MDPDARSLARAYLEQQRKLGTDAVVLSKRLDFPPPDIPADPPPFDSPGSHPGSVNTASGKPPVTPGESRGLPVADALPGIVYDPPTGDLFTKDPIREAATLAAVSALIKDCKKCRLCETRTNTVPGEGADNARLMVVGEGPGRTEDETGRPFVGQAGELLTKILAAIDLPREQVYICNIVKCRPPENRVPQYDEVASCLPYLWRQIELVRPKVILAMGGTAAQSLLDAKAALGAMRNKVHRFRGTPVVVTYHPAALLRNPNWKKPTWDDVRFARRLLDA
jgi:DNA polymerase